MRGSPQSDDVDNPSEALRGSFPEDKAMDMLHYLLGTEGVCQ